MMVGIVSGVLCQASRLGLDHFGKHAVHASCVWARQLDLPAAAAPDPGHTTPTTSTQMLSFASIDGMKKDALAEIPKDHPVIRPRDAVIVPVFIALGPGCGALVGSFYGSPVEMAIFGAVVMAVAFLVAAEKQG